MVSYVAVHDGKCGSACNRRTTVIVWRTSVACSVKVKETHFKRNCFIETLKLNERNIAENRSSLRHSQLSNPIWLQLLDEFFYINQTKIVFWVNGNLQYVPMVREQLWIQASDRLMCNKSW